MAKLLQPRHVPIVVAVLGVIAAACTGVLASLLKVSQGAAPHAPAAGYRADDSTARVPHGSPAERWDADPRSALRSKLLVYLADLDSIEANWEERYTDVELLAERAAFLLEQESYSRAAREVRLVRSSSLEVGRVASTLRNEIQKTLDQLAIESGS